MAEHPNIALLQAGATAWNSGDRDAVMATWAEEPIFHHCGTGPLAGTHRGRQQFLDYLTKSYELTDSTLKLEQVDFMADEGHGVAIFEVTASRNDRNIRASVAYAVTFDGQGKQKEGWFLVDDQAAWDQFWS